MNGGTSLYLSQTGFTGAGPTNPATGQYILTLAQPPADLTKLVVAPAIFDVGGNPGEIVWAFNSPNQIFIFTFSGTGVAAAKNFSLVVYNLT